MLRSYKLALTLCFSTLLLAAPPAEDNSALWKEYGLVEKQVQNLPDGAVTTYRMKDLTGALAAWEWLRSPASHPCNFSPFCTSDGNRTVIQDGNYLLVLTGKAPSQPQVDALLKALPKKRDTSLPAILTFLPAEGKVANSGRYVLGPISLKTFAPAAAGANPGFEQGAEAQVAQYKVGSGAPVNLAVFYYPTPEMARLHAVNFKSSVGPHVKRSGVLLALVYGDASDNQAETLLSRIQYEAKITWNEAPPPGPIKPLYRLLVDILYLSALLSVICLAAGLVYAGMRLYRRRYGTLEAQESMTTLGLGRD